MTHESATSFQQEHQLQELEMELKQTIQQGQWRTVIISRAPSGEVVSMFFPIDDLRLRNSNDMAACELVGQVEPPEADLTQTLFAHLRIRDQKLIAVSSSNALAQPEDDELVTHLVQQFFSAAPANAKLLEG